MVQVFQKGRCPPEYILLGGTEMLLRKAFIVLAVVALVGFVSAAYAAERKDTGGPQPTVVTGKVAAVPADSKYAATVETEIHMAGGMQKVTLQVVKDEQGEKLAKDAMGKTAEVKGIVSIPVEKDAPRTITVKEFKIVEEKK